MRGSDDGHPMPLLPRSWVQEPALDAEVGNVVDDGRLEHDFLHDNLSCKHLPC